MQTSHAMPTMPPELMAVREQLRSTLLESQGLRATDPERALRIARKGLRAARTSGLPRLVIMFNIEICWHQLNAGDYAGALASVEQARSALEAIPNDAEMKSRVDHCAGCVCLYQGDLPRAVELLAPVVAVAERYGGTARAEALAPLAQAYQRLGDYPKALEVFTSILVIWEEMGQTQYQVMTLECIGGIYVELEDWDRALAAFAGCRELADGLGSRMGAASALGNIGRVHASAGRDAEALPILAEALELERELGRRQNEASLLASIAEIEGRNGMLDRAFEHCRRALEIDEAIDDMPGTARALALLGDLHVLRGEYAEARPLLARAIAIAAANGHREIECGAHRVLALACEATGEAGDALDHYKEYMRIEKELHGNHVRRAVANVQMRADLDRMEREREMLLMKAERLELEIAYKQRELTSAALNLAQKSQLLAWLQEQMAPFARSRGKDASELVRAVLPRIRESSDARQTWHAFEEQFNQVHPELIPRLLDRYPSLSPTELKICVLMKINLATKEIADILRTSPRTVEGHRRFIRKKMDLPRNENLYTYLAALK
jgi:tetratricopeptide (TPR) repeat protein